MFKLEEKKIVCKTHGRITGIDCSTLQGKQCKDCGIYLVMKKKEVIKKSRQS